jgi:hypothetical protein
VHLKNLTLVHTAIVMYLAPGLAASRMRSYRTRGAAATHDDDPHVDVADVPDVGAEAPEHFHLPISRLSCGVSVCGRVR